MYQKAKLRNCVIKCNHNLEHEINQNYDVKNDIINLNNSDLLDIITWNHQLILTFRQLRILKVNDTFVHWIIFAMDSIRKSCHFHQCYLGILKFNWYLIPALKMLFVRMFRIYKYSIALYCRLFMDLIFTKLLWHKFVESVHAVVRKYISLWGFLSGKCIKPRFRHELYWPETFKCLFCSRC